MIGLLHDPELDDAQRKLIAEKRAAYDARSKKNSDGNLSLESAGNGGFNVSLGGAGAESSAKRKGSAGAAAMGATPVGAAEAAMLSALRLSPQRAPSMPVTKMRSNSYAPRS